tara:strand:+ start:463 stop:801 length:339 start_codon:yes stop_codon:yes gene_type:complete
MANVEGHELEENTILLTDSGDVLYNVPTDFVGIQFEIDGTTVSSISGGEAGKIDWILHASDSTVIGFHKSNKAITDNSGILFNIDLDGDATGLSNIVCVDSNKNIINVTYNN